MTSGATYLDFQRQADQGLLAQKAGQPLNLVYFSLQEERRLAAEALARPGSMTDDLRRQRQLTDEAVRSFQGLTAEVADLASPDVLAAISDVRQALARLTDQRAAADRSAVDQQTLYAFYTELLETDLRLFTLLSHTENGEVAWISRPLIDIFWAKELLAREDAILARGWPSGRIAATDLQQLQQVIGAQNHLYTVRIVPYVPPAEARLWQDLLSSPAWQAKNGVEQALLRPTAPDANGTVRMTSEPGQWRQSLDQVNQALLKAMEARTLNVVDEGRASSVALLYKVGLTSVIGLAAVIAAILTTWRLTRSLRLRIRELHGQAEELERTLPEVVDRLGRGEQVDVEAETRAITAGDRSSGSDELARLGQALNLARTSALETAVRQSEQHRGFERMLQRIARRTQLLIGQQLRKLDELERKHEDPEVLEGLFDLDHLTARLRRYEENLVILAGGQPQRRWRKPVPLLDVLRAAQSEVQDYRRIALDVEGHPWLSQRAVGPVAHVVAELMENAATFSKPPTPVEVRAAMVGRGLAIEVEDRGLGMDPGQYDAANELMSRPPRMDVLARADDIRLGFYVVARLAAAAGMLVEFRPSAFGGTRVVVLVPAELVIDGDAGLPDATPVEPIPLAARRRRELLAEAPEPTDLDSGHGTEHGMEHQTEPEYGVPGLDAPGHGVPGLDVPGHGDADPFGLPGGYHEAGYPEQGAEYPAPAGGPEHLRHDSPAADSPYPDIAYARVTHLDPPQDAAGETLDQPPLPQRVRQASLAAELRIPPQAYTPERPFTAEVSADSDQPYRAPVSAPRPAPRRSGATIGAFQRQSRAARGLAGHSAVPRTGAVLGDTLEGDSFLGDPLTGDPLLGGPPGGDPLLGDLHTADPLTSAPSPSSWALPGADSRTPRTDDQ